MEPAVAQTHQLDTPARSQNWVDGNLIYRMRFLHAFSEYIANEATWKAQPVGRLQFSRDHVRALSIETALMSSRCLMNFLELRVKYDKNGDVIDAIFELSRDSQARYKYDLRISDLAENAKPYVRWAFDKYFSAESALKSQAESEVIWLLEKADRGSAHITTPVGGELNRMIPACSVVNYMVCCRLQDLGYECPFRSHEFHNEHSVSFSKTLLMPSG